MKILYLLRTLKLVLLNKGCAGFVRKKEGELVQISGKARNLNYFPFFSTRQIQI
jgi:hypothetical protein